jgi:DNA repair photolyase
MSTQLNLLPSAGAPVAAREGAHAPRNDLAGRATMNGKPVFTREAKSVINFESKFSHKLLCDGPTFSAGDACVYSCTFCYVGDLMRKLRATAVMEGIEGNHEDIVVRRARPAELVRQQLTDRYGVPKFKDPKDRRVIYSSPLVDCAGNMELVRETIEICSVILELTNWQIRLLSKSNLLPKVAEGLSDLRDEKDVKERMIFGVSTGTLDDGIAKAFEAGTPLVSKRIQSLHWLQDNGFRTYGMVCPSLPQHNYPAFAREAAAAIRADRCEHVWAEVINLRGESFTRTERALADAGFAENAYRLREVTEDRDLWERYARATFDAHARVLRRKLRFLQYVTPTTKEWWERQKSRGAVVL